jgi:CRP-like cAMP-binding protein
MDKAAHNSNGMLQTLHQLSIIPDDEAQKLARVATLQNIAQGEKFIAAGQVPRKFAFVQRGLFRYYYLDGAGKEFTKGFFPENTFVSAYSAMVKQTPSYFTIEALEDASVFVIDYEAWKKLIAGHSCWKDILIAILEKGFIKKEKREREFLLHDAETRYVEFRAEYPQLESRLTQAMVASYLGITAVALSRIRKKMGLINIG